MKILGTSIDIVSWIIMLFAILLTILMLPVCFIWKEEGVDPRTANEIDREDYERTKRDMGPGD